MFGRIKQKAKAAKEKQIQMVLVSVEKADKGFLDVATLGDITGLHAAVLPLLARLQQRALIEPVWSRGALDPKLGYRLTAEGRAYLQGLTRDDADTSGSGQTPRG